MSKATSQDRKLGQSGKYPSASVPLVGEKVLLPADYYGIDSLIEACWTEVGEELTRQDYGRRTTKIRIALHEALVNAWKHGNHRRPDLPITFRWRFAENFSFEVQDMGQGFSQQILSEPFTPERLIAENGRGIHIIRICADTVCWKKGGRLIIVAFERTE